MSWMDTQAFITVDFYDFIMNDVYTITITIAMTAGYHRTEDQNELLSIRLALSIFDPTSRCLG